MRAKRSAQASTGLCAPSRFREIPATAHDLHLTTFSEFAPVRFTLTCTNGSEFFQWHSRTGFDLAPSNFGASHSGFAEPREWRIQMSMQSRLSAAALGTLAALSAMATAPASAAPTICDQAVSRQACGDHMAYAATLKRRGDTSPTIMKNLDPRYNQAMQDAGGGGGGGGGGGR